MSRSGFGIRIRIHKRPESGSESSTLICVQGTHPGPGEGCRVPAPAGRVLRRGHLLQRIRTGTDLPRRHRGDPQVTTTRGHQVNVHCGTCVRGQSGEGQLRQGELRQGKLRQEQLRQGEVAACTVTLGSVALRAVAAGAVAAGTAAAGAVAAGTVAAGGSCSRDSCSKDSCR